MKPAQTSGEHVTLRTRLTPEEALLRLSHAIEEQTPIFPLLPRPRNWLFAGSIYDNSFSISRIPAGKRMYQNQIDGFIEKTETGSIIEMTIRPHSDTVLIGTFSIIMLSFWGVILIGVPLYFSITGQLPLKVGLFPVVVVTVFVLLMRSIHRPTSKLDLDALTALGHLKAIFQAEAIRDDPSLAPA